MLHTTAGRVTDVRKLDERTLECQVEAGGERRKALAYIDLCGEIAAGDEVVVNTTAVDLGLGTGGYDFVVCSLSKRGEVKNESPGHIMKLRYTPLQHSAECEEETAGEDAAIADLAGMPVVAAGLHSHIALIAAGVKAKEPDARIAYAMTDGAALPIQFSNLVRALEDARLIDDTITCGQAFGGRREAVNVYSALAAAREASKASVTIVCQGPGNVGTSTGLGFSAIEAGQIINAAHSLKGRPVLSLRMSKADKRERHRLISHHSLTVLSRVALAGTMAVLPFMDADDQQEAYRQLQSLKLFEHHEIRSFDGAPGVALLKERGLKLESMGRGYDDDPLFFLAASAAGRCAASMLSKDFWG
jgi:hypothetical protein